MEQKGGTMEKLKPCPFCGGEANIVSTSSYSDRNELSKVFVIVCGRCGLRSSNGFRVFAKISNSGDAILDEKEKVEAIDAWNRRADNG